jgi:hypothetical protein
MTDFINSVPAAMWVVLNTIIGTLLLKGLEKYLNRNVDRREVSRDYRAEIKELQDRLDALDDELEKARKKSFALEEDVAKLRRFIIEQGHTPPSPTHDPKPA